MDIIELNHVALHVANLGVSKAFYGEVLELPEKARPAFDFEGAWYSLGGHWELHLIAGRQAAVHSHSRGTHFALRVPDLDAAAEFFRARGLDFQGPRDRPDGARQIFLRDPDGYFIEFCCLPE